MMKTVNLKMYESAEEIQNYFLNVDNRLEQGFSIWYFQYEGYAVNWKMWEHYGLLYDHSEDYMSTLTKVIMLPEVRHFVDMIPHKDIIELDSKFSDFKAMVYESRRVSNDIDSSEERGESPFDFFKTYDELWLGFVMMDRHQKRWNGKKWVHTDIFPDYFKMDKETARQDGYPDPDRLQYISGLRGYTEQ